MNDDLNLPAEFDMPASRRLGRREHLTAALAERGSASRAPRHRRRRWALAVAGAGLLAIAAIPAVDLVDSGSSDRGVLDKAVAATTSDASIYHVTQLFTVRHETADPRVLKAFDFEGVDIFEDVTRYTESWRAPGGRSRTLVFEADGGGRGPLLQEQAWHGSMRYSFDARANCVSVTRARRGARPRRRPLRPQRLVPPEIEPTKDPGVQLRELREQGRLRLAGTEQVRGRSAYRLASETWVDPDEKGHTERVEFLVDTETYLPLEQRNFSTQLGVSGLPKDLRPAQEMYETPVTSKATSEFLTYERLPSSAENLANLKPRPHPDAAVFDPHQPRSTCR